MSSNLQWALNREALATRLRLILVEQIGHGRSPAPDSIDGYGRVPTLAGLDAIRTELGIDRWWIGGHSLGGAVAIRYALANPDRVKGVVFTNTRAAFGLARHRAPNEGDRITDGIDSLRDLPFHPIHAKRFPDGLKAEMVAAADAMTPNAVANTVAHRDDWASADELHRLEMPVLLVNGRYEKGFQPCVDRARVAMNDLTVVELEGGHSVNVEVPDGFDRAVLSFIDDHRAGA